MMSGELILHSMLVVIRKLFYVVCCFHSIAMMFGRKKMQQKSRPNLFYQDIYLSFHGEDRRSDEIILLCSCCVSSLFPSLHSHNDTFFRFQELSTAKVRQRSHKENMRTWRKSQVTMLSNIILLVYRAGFRFWYGTIIKSRVSLRVATTSILWQSFWPLCSSMHAQP